LRAQRLDEPVEFLLMEGRSEDATLALLDEHSRADPRIHVLDNPGRIVPCALNIGLRHARGRFVVHFSAHARYPPDYLAVALARLRRGDVEWVSGPQLAQGEGRWSRRVALALSSWLGIGGASFRRLTSEEIDVESGFGGMWHRATLESLGGWDESFPVNEDADMAARIRARGGRIVCLPQLAASYSPRDSLPGLWRQYWRYGHYRVRTVRRHPQSLRRSHLLAPGLVLALLLRAAGPRRLRRRAGLALRLYAVALVGASARCAGRGDPRDVAALPAVFGVMHLAWGAGFLAGCVRFGLPVAAFAHVTGVEVGSAGDEDPRAERLPR
jgi:GT2 family glycosyltransferase